MNKIVQVVYYTCFAWLIMLVLAEIGALIIRLPFFSHFLQDYFFSFFTWFSIGFVFVRFVIIVVTDLVKK